MSRHGVTWSLQQVDYDNINFSKTFTRSSLVSPRNGEQQQVTPSHEDSGFLDGSFSFSSDVIDSYVTDYDVTSRLRDAILDPTKRADIPGIISSWPRSHLRLKDVVTPDELFWSIPDSDVLWRMMFQSLVNRQPDCNLEVLDLTQFQPSSGLVHLMMQVLPVLHLPAEDRNPEHILKTITSQLGLRDPVLLQRLRRHVYTVLQHPVFLTSTALNNQDTTLSILLDSVPVDEDRLLFLSTLMCAGLQDNTGVYVLPKSIVSRGEWSRITRNGDKFDNNELLYLRQKHVSLVLEGLFLTSPEPHLKDVPTYVPNLTSLSLSGLNTTPQNNHNNNNNTITITQKTDCVDLCRCISQLNNLKRFELNNCNLIGCLPEILTALRRPLEYLSISGSTLATSDVRIFKTWKYSNMLKDLNFSELKLAKSSEISENTLETKISDFKLVERQIIDLKHMKGTQDSHEDTEELMASICDILQYLPSLVVLDTHGNSVTKETLVRLGEAVSEHLGDLKVLNVKSCEYPTSYQSEKLEEKCDESRSNPDKEILDLVRLLRNHLVFQILYISRVCRCVDGVTCSPGCKMEFWSKLDEITQSVPVKVCVQMN